ncbi:glutamate-gated chloride channel isoform X2 [Folsomia candida]|uniref:glutamate-gated chloride channel isoform X2 n=1 Tax=Folsomia candida TaxID=158441 RepID=UPI000B8FAB00|nr:glutamate-gated chloride channel isoform X2 [Folsomia candida]
MLLPTTSCILPLLIASCALFPTLGRVEATTIHHAHHKKSGPDHGKDMDKQSSSMMEDYEDMSTSSTPSPPLPEPMELVYQKVQIGQPVFAPLNISMDLSEKAALDLLITNSRYDRRSMPPSLVPLDVNVSVLLLTLASPDESSLKYEVEFLMNMVWVDSRLKYNITNTTSVNLTYSADSYEAIPMRANPRRRDYLDALHHFPKVWIPDVYFVKHGDFRMNLDPNHIALRLHPNGTVAFTTRRHLILSCQGELGIFPFDDPQCSWNIESISNERDALEFKWHTDTGILRKSPNLSFLNAYLAKNETTYCNSSHWRGNYSCLGVQLTFNRDRAYYFTTVFIPDIILVTSSFITFWLEWNAVPARIMLGVTTMLNFFTTSNTFRSTLPVVSNLTAMNIWDGFSMFFIYASLLEFVIVNYIGRKRPRRAYPEPPDPHSSAQLNKVEQRGVAGSPSGMGGSGGTENNQGDICTTFSPSPSHAASIGGIGIGIGWTIPTVNLLRRRIIENPIRVAKTVDVISRVVFPIAYAAFLIFFFVKHKAFDGSYYYSNEEYDDR